VVDTNSFLDWQVRYFPTDVFVSLIPAFDALIEEKRLWTVELVEEEIGIVGTPELHTWIKARKRILVRTSDLLVDALAIQNAYPGFKDNRYPYEEADAYLIALAKRRGATVVTQETPAATKKGNKRTHYIPDVCRALGVPCINLLDMMRQENWKL
jgi:hypothetical protein